MRLVTRTMTPRIYQDQLVLVLQLLDIPQIAPAGTGCEASVMQDERCPFPLYLIPNADVPVRRVWHNDSPQGFHCPVPRDVNCSVDSPQVGSAPEEASMAGALIQDFVLLTGACQRAYVRLGSGCGRRRRHDVADVLFRTRPSCLSYHSRKERAT